MHSSNRKKKRSFDISSTVVSDVNSTLKNQRSKHLKDITAGASRKSDIETNLLFPLLLI